MQSFVYLILQHLHGESGDPAREVHACIVNFVSLYIARSRYAAIVYNIANSRCRKLITCIYLFIWELTYLKWLI